MGLGNISRSVSPEKPGVCRISSLRHENDLERGEEEVGLLCPDNQPWSRGRSQEWCFLKTQKWPLWHPGGATDTRFSANAM